jgi:predicted transcriptional regulator
VGKEGKEGEKGWDEREERRERKGELMSQIPQTNKQTLRSNRIVFGCN